MVDDLRRRMMAPVRRMVELLVHGDYAELIRIAGGPGLVPEDAEGIKEVLDLYPYKPVMPPEQAYARMDTFEIENSKPRRWGVDMPLWTAEEGESDLTLQLTLTERRDGFEVEFDGVHAL